MPGSIVVVDSAPLSLALSKRLPPQKTYKVHVDGSVINKTVGTPKPVKVDPGMRTVRVTVNGYRTNKVNVEVVEGGNHVVCLTSVERGAATLLSAFGLLGMLIAYAFPGIFWRASGSDA